LIGEPRHEVLLAQLAEHPAVHGERALEPLELVDFATHREQWHVLRDGRATAAGTDPKRR
jgi:hypothetical protein